MDRNNFLILILFIKMTNRGRLISTKEEVRTWGRTDKHLLRLNRGRTDKHLLRLNRGRTDKHLLRLNRGRTDKHLLRLNRGRTDKHLLRLNRGRTDKTSTLTEPGPHGKLHYPSQGLIHQTNENHQIFDPKKNS